MSLIKDLIDNIERHIPGFDRYEKLDYAYSILAGLKPKNFTEIVKGLEIDGILEPEVDIEKVSKEKKGITDKTYPTETLLDLIHRLLDLYKSGKTKTISIFTDFGFGKSHMLAFIYDIINQAESDEKALIRRLERRRDILDKVIKVEKNGIKVSDDIKSLKLRIEGLIEKYKDYPIKRSKVIALAGYNMDASKTLYENILEKAGIEETPSGPKEAVELLRSLSEHRIILIDELDMFYGNVADKSVVEKDLIFLKHLQKETGFFVVLAGNVYEGTEGKITEILNKISKVCERIEIQKREESADALVSIIFTAAASYTPIKLFEEYAIDADSLRILINYVDSYYRGRRDKGIKDVRRNRVRYFLTRFALYLRYLKQLDRRKNDKYLKFNLFSGAYPSELMKHIRAFKYQRPIGDLLSILDSLIPIKPRTPRDIRERAMANTIVKALLFSKENMYPKEEIISRFCMPDGEGCQSMVTYVLKKLMKVGLVREVNDVIYLEQLRTILEDKLINFEANYNQGRYLDALLELTGVLYQKINKDEIRDLFKSSDKTKFKEQLEKYIRDKVRDILVKTYENYLNIEPLIGSDVITSLARPVLVINLEEIIQRIDEIIYEKLLALIRQRTKNEENKETITADEVINGIRSNIEELLSIKSTSSPLLEYVRVKIGKETYTFKEYKELIDRLIRSIQRDVENIIDTAVKEAKDTGRPIELDSRNIQKEIRKKYSDQVEGEHIKGRFINSTIEKAVDKYRREEALRVYIDGNIIYIEPLSKEDMLREKAEKIVRKIAADIKSRGFYRLRGEKDNAELVEFLKKLIPIEINKDLLLVEIEREKDIKRNLTDIHRGNWFAYTYLYPKDKILEEIADRIFKKFKSLNLRDITDEYAKNEIERLVKEYVRGPSYILDEIVSRAHRKYIKEKEERKRALRRIATRSKQGTRSSRTRTISYRIILMGDRDSLLELLKWIEERARELGVQIKLED